MSDTTDATSGVLDDRRPDEAEGVDQTGAARRRRTGDGLSGMLLPELQNLATSLGISGTARLRKGELVAAIEGVQQGGGARSGAARGEVAARAEAPRTEVRADVRPDADAGDGDRPTGARIADSEPRARIEPATNGEERAPRRATRAAGPPEARIVGDTPTGRSDAGESGGADRGAARERAVEGGERTERTGRADAGDRGGRTGNRTGERFERSERPDRGGERVDRGGPVAADDDGDDGSGRRGRRNRFRERRRGRGDRPEGGNSSSGGGGGGHEPQVSEDDVLVPVAGILDVMDNYAFVRTSGYLSGSNDVYVSMSQVKRHGLRRGDAVTGAVRQSRDGEARRDKYNPLVRLDTINGMEPEEARRRPEFYKLTPLYPQERLRLETETNILTTRVIDLVMPIGKGQRALIVSPPKAGKTMVLQAIANAITTNNPECHLMVVLVDERPEEVTDMQRSVKGEVIASTFDRPPGDHTTVAELAIERAKRLVELGHDVVVLLDSITRLGRAYNLAAPASGRILSGGIDSTALYPPKRFLGAARNIENGGSLTILATALVETGSMMDTVIFEEFKGTGNAELKLDRKIADKRVFPAIDIDPSGTRKEEILMASDELAIVHKLRKVLHALDSQQALDLLLDRLKKTKTNVEFLMQIAQTTPGE